MPQEDSKSVDLRQLLSIVLSRKWLIVLPLFLVTAVAYGATFFLTPMYRSSTIIWIDRPNTVSRELVNLLGREGNQRMSSDDQRRELQALQNEITSQAYLTQLIRDLGLDRDADLTREAARMREDNPDRSMEQLKTYLLMESLRKKISVSYVGMDQIQLTVESADPTKARDMVEHLTEIMEQEKSRYEMDKILDNQSFADLQLQRTEYQYNEILDSLSRARARMEQLQLPQGISSSTNRREIESEIDETRQELADYQGELSDLKGRLEDADLDNPRMRYTDSLVSLRTELENEVSAYAAQMEKYPWTDQAVISAHIRIRDNIRLLEREIGRAVDLQFASYPENLRQIIRRYFVVTENIDVLNSMIAQLNQDYGRLVGRINYLPRVQTEIDELERRVTEARRYRDAFRSEETTVEILSERAKDRTKYKVIEPAKIPLEPYSPDKKKIMMMGILLGLVIGGAAVFLAEVMDNSFKRVDDVEEMLGLKVLATIPKIERLHASR